MDLKNIGLNIKKIRMEKGYTQSKLAEMSDISNVHMSHIETGIVAMSLECLLNICNSLNVSPDSILMGEYKITHKSASDIITDNIKDLTSDEKRFLIESSKLLSKLKINRD